jgi:signal peptidase II
LFIENEGMAWEFKLGRTVNYFNSFRIAAVGGIGYWLWDSVKEEL